MERIGVREARQHLSRYLDRVVAGESFTVTDHGRPVAVLAPVPPDDDPLAHLVARGLADPPKGPMGQLPPLLDLPPGLSSEQIFADLREDRL